MLLKKCKECGEVLSVDCFSKSKNVKDGYENKCKQCRLKKRKKYINVCIKCGKEFSTMYKNSKYCCQSCKPQSAKNRIKVACAICGKEKEVTPYRIKHEQHFYCSDECKNKGYSLFHSGENSKLYSSVKVKCDNCGEIFSKVKSQYEKSNYNYCCKKCQSEGFKTQLVKENNPNWNSEKTDPERTADRKYLEYNLWRTKVYEKNNYTCQRCKSSRSGTLNAHHILNYTEHIDARLDVNNGITLCKHCHKKFHKIYGYTKNTKEQLVEFLNKNNK